MYNNLFECKLNTVVGFRHANRKGSGTLLNECLTPEIPGQVKNLTPRKI
jgi:hypothetical protein